jgi:hypothetical protein
MEDVFERLKNDLMPAVVHAVEEGAATAREILVSRIKKGKKAEGGDYSLYSDTHTRRRKKEGLQTSHKDLHFSGTLFENFIEVHRAVTPTSASVTLSFQGQAYRRPDQKPATNIQVATWLSQQEDKDPIVVLSKAEQEKVKQSMVRRFGDDIKNIRIS